MNGDTLKRGPCWYCRREMNWISADGLCWPVCRYCLQYLREALYWAPKYGQRLIERGFEMAVARREPGCSRDGFYSLYRFVWEGSR